MSSNKTIIRFDEVSYSYIDHIPVLEEVGFSFRQGMKVALMGQNGAGKSTLFKLLTGELRPEEGRISLDPNISVSTAYQVIAEDDKDLTIEEFFIKRCNEDVYEVRSKIASVLDVVNLHAPTGKLVKSFSGGQQARLLMASALIQDPDLLLLDEPTNNLDKDGIEHLTEFLKDYSKSVIVISHDADFLNEFTEGVLYLDAQTKKIEQYAGDYHDVVEEIRARVEQQRRKNAQMARGIQESKDKANFFAFKGGKMRKLAKKMRDNIETLESEKVTVRKEDRTISKFTIPAQQLFGEVVKINSFTIMKDHKEIEKPTKVILYKEKHLLITGPNGIGKSTLIESIANGTAAGTKISSGIRVGYYSQDFTTLNFKDTVRDVLVTAMKDSGGIVSEQRMRSVAAGFLLTGELISSTVESLSEGQKGLLSFARLVILEPGLLILDEPTNHINFRHIPIIAKALSDYKGAMILVSHVSEFVEKVRIDERLNLLK